MIHALVLAAATCSMDASVQSAGALLSKADAAIAQRDNSNARTSYDAAMNDLNAADWFPKDKSCDEPRYTLQRYVTTLHSLSVAVAVGSMPATEAAQHVRDMQDGMYRSLPFSAIDAFIRQYPELKKSERKYIMAVESAAQPQKVAAHEPNSSACQSRDVDAEVLDAVTAYPPDGSPVGKGTQGVVKVNIAADGTITSASISRSTYDMHLDQAALAAAIESTYLPAVKNCLPAAGSLDFTVTFQPKK
jgi:TonB family protein